MFRQALAFVDKRIAAARRFPSSATRRSRATRHSPTSPVPSHLAASPRALRACHNLYAPTCPPRVSL